MMLKKVLGVNDVRHWFYLAAKPPNMGVVVDGIACPLHRPTAYSRQKR
jgi:hypothetical protein